MNPPAILKESVKNLPIFIDTPLGRLDEEHRDSITKKYYPALSEQVVLFSTNSEITPKRFKEISGNISKSYLLFNDGVKKKKKNGYFTLYGSSDFPNLPPTRNNWQFKSFIVDFGIKGFNF